MAIRVNLDPLEATTAFPYLSCMVNLNNSDWVDLYRNLRKSQRRWGVVAKVVGNTGASVKSWVIMYR